MSYSLHRPPPTSFGVNGGKVASATNSTITDSNATFTVNQYTNFFVYIVYGTGTGQIALIASNTATVITINGTWSQNPDSTSEYYILSQLGTSLPNFGVLGSTSQKTESALDNNVFTLTPIGLPGTYRLTIIISVSVASSAVLGWTATYHDANGTAIAPTNLFCQQVGGTGALTVTTSAAIDITGTQTVDIDNSGTPIVIKLTLTGGTFTAKVTGLIERLI
jgi:hypothetical protein